MFKIASKLTLLIAVTLFMASCDSQTVEDNIQTSLPIEEKAGLDLSLEKNGLKLTKVESPKFDEAELQLSGIDEKEGKATFNFSVANYELGNQTPDAEAKQCANSGKGQHIHFIANNAPYSAHYNAEIEKEMTDSSFILLAFLSRSYHESIKSPKAAVVKEITLGNAAPLNTDLTQPMMFYSRPKGTYLGQQNISKVLLDFYLANVTLSEDGYKVRATINGTEFYLVDWTPYFVEGLSEGDMTVKLELLDKDNNLVDAPFNPVTRTVKLDLEEPLD